MSAKYTTVQQMFLQMCTLLADTDTLKAAHLLHAQYYTSVKPNASMHGADSSTVGTSELPALGSCKALQPPAKVPS
jgi:hypothetical protein